MKDFWTKNKVPIILFGIILLLIGSVALMFNRVKKDAVKMALLEDKLKNSIVDQEVFARESAQLRLRYDSLNKIKTVLSADLVKYKSQLYWLQVKHQKDIDSLIKSDTPVDTLYIRTTLLFPNYNQENLLFPYSGSQVKQIYAVGVRYPRLKEEYDQAKTVMNSYYVLNEQYKRSEANLNEQLSVMKRDMSNSAGQIGLQQDQIKLLNKTVSRKTFWQYTEGILGIAGWVVAGVK